MSNQQSNEIWKEIEGYSEFYEVSNLGRVRVKRRLREGRHGPMWRSGKVLKPKTNNRGYYQVNLHMNGSGSLKAVHRLVAKAFVPNEGNLLEVNHKNAVKKDNTASNLEWCTRKQNMEHASRMGRMIGTGRKKKIRSLEPKIIRRKTAQKCPVKKLNELGVPLGQYESIAAAAKEIGCAPSSISEAISKNTKVRGFKWQYDNQQKQKDG